MREINEPHRSLLAVAMRSFPQAGSDKLTHIKVKVFWSSIGDEVDESSLNALEDRGNARHAECAYGIIKFESTVSTCKMFA